MAKFRKLNIEIKSSYGYGQYQIVCIYKKQLIKVHTTNSECYDYLEDDSNKVKHLEAKQYAYSIIVNKYNNCY